MSIPQSQSMKQFVRAGAGAGKTWNLTRQVIGKALAYQKQEGQWPKIVVTTFTRKATQELKERLLTYAIKECPEAIEFVRSGSYLNITTMHGLFDSFLRKHSKVLGLPSQFKVTDSAQADLWRKQVLKKVFEQDVELSSLLGRFDIRRLLQILKPFEEICWQNNFKLPRAFDLEKITLNMSSVAGENLSAVIQRGFNEVEGEKWQNYFTYLSELSGIVKGDESWGSKKSKIEKIWGREAKPRRSKNNPGLSEDLDTRLKGILTQFKSFMEDPEFDPQLWLDSEKYFYQMKKLSELYVEGLFNYKLKEASVEVNDLENLTMKIYKETPEVFKQFSQDWDMWFIDEFQDTSPKQIELLEPFIANKPCYIVGDPQQSIYLFRGSRSQVFFDKQEEMRNQGHEVLFLQDNYRSQKSLLEFFNQFFPSLNKEFQPMLAKEKSLPGVAVEVAECSTEIEDCEVLHMIEQVGNLLKSGVSPKDIAVLGRTNGHLTKVQSLLSRYGYPVVSHSSSNFYSRREILDALSLLKILLNPWDDLNLMSFARSPWLALKDSMLLEIIKDNEQSYWKAFVEYFKSHPDYEPGQMLLQAIKEKSHWGVAWVFRKLLISFGFFDFSHRIDGTGRREANLWKLVNLVEKTSREPGDSLMKLIEEGAGATELEELFDNMDASSPVEPDKINLMTIHASKGLEFPYIFMPFLGKRPNSTKFFDFCLLEDEGLWAARLPMGEFGKFIGSPVEKKSVEQMKAREIEESLRVLYVGMTRAEKKLYLSWTGKPENRSWAMDIQKFLENSDMLENVKVAAIEDGKPAQYQAEQVKAEVPVPFKESRNRFYIEPQSITLKEGGVVERAKGTQKQRWMGVMVHRLLENLHNYPLDSVKSLADSWMGVDAKLAKEAIEFVSQLTEPPMQELFEKGHSEWGYQWQLKDRLEERRIDLWGVVDGELWIVDYKTGSSFHKDKAYEQLRGYYEALKVHLNWQDEKKVNLCPLYIFENKTFTKKISDL